ncbi:hypothetical protein WJX72_002844 [[Myrmecia] bisecta]|uniref:Uncharacterized protein n=1 Tax=[Myrmecia] bisecta TaxID=41462 RepID=A0AAW1Q6T1_9CHLO
MQEDASSSEQPDSTAFARNLEAERMYNSLQQQTKIGSEYGEGFVQWRISGEPLQLDVDTLNERLKVSGADRMRQAMRPDEAFGMIFNWDGVIANTRYVQRQAWQRLAQEENLPFPSIDRQIYDIRPERAITEVLQWTRDWGAAQRMAWRVANLFAEEFGRLSEPLPGVREWLLALNKANVPCAIVSNMDQLSVRAALDRMGLGTMFQAKVTVEDGMETMSQRFLSAALKLGRPPNQCVVFESCPRGVTAAHNCTMKAVALHGAHRGYQLQQADLTCSSLTELTVYNVRRLFANKGSEFMDLRHQQASQLAGRRGRWPARITNAVCDP